MCKGSCNKHPKDQGLWQKASVFFKTRIRNDDFLKFVSLFAFTWQKNWGTKLINRLVLYTVSNNISAISTEKAVWT